MAVICIILGFFFNLQVAQARTYVVGQNLEANGYQPTASAVRISLPSLIPWAEVVAGDVIQICSMQSQTINITAGGSATLPVVIQGCPLAALPGGVLAPSGPGIIVSAENVIVEGLRVRAPQGDGIQVRANGVTIRSNTVTGSKHGIRIDGPLARSIKIEKNEVSGNELVGIILHQRVVSGLFEKIEILNNRVHHNGAHGIRVWFNADTGADSGIEDLKVLGNIVNSNAGDGVVVVHEGANYETTAARFFKVRIEGNNITQNTGGLAVRGVGSRSGNFGESLIARNICKHNRGVTGGLNIFWSYYVDITDNDFSSNTSLADNIDGNGLLIDHGNSQLRVFKNRMNYNYGTGKVNSGHGIMVLDSVKISIYDNMIYGNEYAFFFSGQEVQGEILVTANNIAQSKKGLAYVEEVVKTKAIFLDGNTVTGNATMVVNNPQALVTCASNNSTWVSPLLCHLNSLRAQ